MREMEMSPEMAELFKELAAHHIHRYDDANKIYKYTSIETAKKILATGSLQFSTAESLNDNDCESCLVNFNLNGKQLSYIKKARLKQALQDHQHRTPKEIKEFLKTKEGRKLLNSIPDSKFLDVIKETYQSIFSDYGFMCATTSNNNDRMWEKFGEHGKGVCIELKFPTYFTSEYFGLKVFYDRDFKAFDLYDKHGEAKPLSIYRWFFTKRFDYKFEDEMRIVSYHGYSIATFPKEIFTGLFYGKYTSQKDIEALESLLQDGYSFTKGQRII